MLAAPPCGQGCGATRQPSVKPELSRDAHAPHARDADCHVNRAFRDAATDLIFKLDN